MVKVSKDHSIRKSTKVKQGIKKVGASKTVKLKKTATHSLKKKSLQMKKFKKVACNLVMKSIKRLTKNEKKPVHKMLILKTINLNKKRKYVLQKNKRKPGRPKNVKNKRPSTKKENKTKLKRSSLVIKKSKTCKNLTIVNCSGHDLPFNSHKKTYRHILLNGKNDSNSSASKIQHYFNFKTDSKLSLSPEKMNCKPVRILLDRTDVLSHLKDGENSSVQLESSEENQLPMKSEQKIMISKHTQVDLQSLCDSTEYRCEICPYMTTKAFNLKRHVLCHDDDRLYECLSCDYSSNNWEYITKHKQLHHKPTICNALHSTYQSKRMVTHKDFYPNKNGMRKLQSNHLQEDNSKLISFDEKTLKNTIRIPGVCRLGDKLCCLHCPFISKTMACVLEHIEGHVKQYEHQCPYCDYSTDLSHVLMEHNSMHFAPLNQKVQGYMALRNCDVDLEQMLKNSLQIRNLEQGNIFICEYCEREFKDGPALYDHEQLHLRGIVNQ